MVTNFTGFGQGVLGKPLPAASTLRAMRKSELIELLHLSERNYETLKFAYGNAVDNSKCNRCPIMQMRGEKEENGD